ncbi:transcription-repair coupling factor [Phormidium tenue]|uniref:Transcription-repair-coupling factor n=1 Tax=Phormidium tenue NIES-30 TaxID=549789 RepID=A0A1U7J547_9CYAN|nr:transcription-repair coupling factor [Phormidium tenue]MBD2232592.1 transcription-repair coupling factor [Phormidium tenue FACHB-1052]OKH47728.1 transcription-repair coupling factor [Phormidium tenue NIES-30]
MAFSSITRALQRSPLAKELLAKLDQQGQLVLNGVARLPKGLVSSALALAQQRPLLVITATLEEAGRWATQLEAMGWDTVHFYPTSEASPYDPFDQESEMTWGQLQVLADLLALRAAAADSPPRKLAIVATERALQPHLPPVSALEPYCLRLELKQEINFKALGQRLATLGYERVTVVETEGQWAQRGDIIDVYPVASELPVRLELFGDELERLREFDPATQRSLDAVDHLVLTPTQYGPVIIEQLRAQGKLEGLLSEAAQEGLESGILPEGTRRWLGLAFSQPASLLDYLPETTLMAVDEVDQCQAHSDRWLEHVEDHWNEVRSGELGVGSGGDEEDGEVKSQKSKFKTLELPKIHRSFLDALGDAEVFPRIDLSEIAEANSGLNLSSRPVQAIPHQFGKLAETIRKECDRKYTVWLASAQPSRSVSLLQEHDCPAQFIPNPKDFNAIDKLHTQHVPVAVKYSGLAELEGFVLPTFRIVVVTDREFFGQHTLATGGYVRKRRRAASKQVDPNKMKPGDFVVHRSHGIGKFIKLESLVLNNETRDYLVIQYADGLLRVAADQVGSLSRYRAASGQAPVLNKMTSTAWEKTKGRAKKAIQKVAVDLLRLYAQRAKMEGFSYPADMPWQQELEDSFPYQATPDQLKAVQDVKRDMESDRPMDRLVCGDVGFGKTEVALRAIFKAVTAGQQVALLAPTTILTQQHYHTLKERFAPYPIQVGLLNRFRSLTEKKDILQRLKTGELDVVVGTHQLLGKGVTFKSLGLLVVDEEQRFGVNQKERIKSLKTQVDVLTLSATPIPRTLYMALSGVREMSLITTPPPSRRPIKTHLSPHDSEAIRTAIRQELDRGGQVFYVVPRVEGIEETSAKIREMVPAARIAIAHGQMDEGELESTMLTFSNGDAEVLLCTTIIESGLDIPRVNTILIEDAHRFGLSQLYQLRGRVGRAGIQAHAWLFYPKKSLTDKARQRLRAIQEFTQLGSGYQLAMRDMEIRGVGNLLGAEQSGQMDAIGFDLYMDMLEEEIAEIRGQDIPKVEDTQVDLNVTAFVPNDYIPDLEQKMGAYRSLASANSKVELMQIAADLSDRYGPIPYATEQLVRMLQLKLVAKHAGFSRIKPEGKQHVVMETPMEEPAWKKISENLPSHLKTRFVYSGGKVVVRGLGVLKPEKQLESLTEWLGYLQGAIAEPLAS